MVAGIFEHWDAYVGKDVPVVGDLRPMRETFQILSRAVGVPVKYAPVPYTVFAGFGFPGAADLAVCLTIALCNVVGCWIYKYTLTYPLLLRTPAAGDVRMVPLAQLPPRDDGHVQAEPQGQQL